MEFDTLKSYLFNLPESRLDFPQGTDTMVFKILGKAFAYISWQSDPIFVSLKCNPDRAIQLRKEYSGVVPSYHQNRTHWISIFLGNDDIPDELILQWVKDSFNLAINELPGFLRNRIIKKIAKLNEGSR
ncbi:MAG: MmcQ/YjbR family DNA-binding protein [Anaerolineaceae bacterium]|nr:MmcQ/YjbR family DNA-binding protein [Anaerolineaceae bacterium]